jgi:type II secretion system protein I
MPFVKEISFKRQGFALIEVLVAVTIVSIVVVSIYRGVSAGSIAIGQNSNLTKAILIAQSRMNEYRIAGLRGTDLSHEEVKEFQGFTFSRTTERFEHPMLGPLPAKKTVITVFWSEQNWERKYSLFTVYFEL